MSSSPPAHYNPHPMFGLRVPPYVPTHPGWYAVPPVKPLSFDEVREMVQRAFADGYLK